MARSPAEQLYSSAAGAGRRSAAYELGGALPMERVKRFRIGEELEVSRCRRIERIERSKVTPAAGGVYYEGASGSPGTFTQDLREYAEKAYAVG